MSRLGNPAITMDILKKHDFRFQKRYGQNFLIDQNVLERIADAGMITKEDFVLEIGPGIGTLTQILAEKAGKVLAVEIDTALIPILEETLSDYGNVEVLNMDILKADLHRLIDEKNGGRPIKVVANLPYYITTPIIMELLESKIPLISITIMIQKEVTDRMKAVPGTKDYGALSLAVQYFARPEVLFTVSPGCFVPRPNVESSVIRLDRYEKIPYEPENEKLLFSLIRASFNQRRKTLVNGISNATGLGFSKEDVVKALGDMDLSAMVRGETLSLEQFVQLSNLLGKKQ